MKEVTLHVVMVRINSDMSVYSCYGDSTKDVSLKAKEFIEDWFIEDLEDFDLANSLHFIEEDEEEDEDTDYLDKVLDLMRDHLHSKENKAFEIILTEKVTQKLDNKFNILDIEVE
jgi:hypothetical protein